MSDGAASVPVHVFVAASGNAFMTDIADWIVEAAIASGRPANIVDDRLPIPDGSINLVVAPHEFYVLRDDDDAAVRAAARCSIPICTEQPGTPWFKLSAGLCEGSPLVVDINDVGAAALAELGFHVHRLRLGAVASMGYEVPERDERRDIDVVFLGGATPRRERVLAGLAPVLWDRPCEIRTFSFSRPVTGDEPGLVFGADKYELLARSKVIVNIHRGDAEGNDSDDYFEWARLVEAMANGCVVVTEPSIGHDPLVVGEHFIECRADQMAATIDDLLNDPARCSAVSAAARAAVTGPLSFDTSVAELLAVADPIVAEVSNAHHGGESPRWGRVFRRRGVGRVTREGPPPLLPVFAPYRGLRKQLFDQLLAEMAHRRELGGFRSLLDHGDADHVNRFESTTWANADADITVVVTVYDYADVVTQTLDSIASSVDVSVEIVIVDDASTDGAVQVVQDWMARHDDVPVLLLARSANCGLGPARNLAIEHARAEFVMILDADNLLYPNCLGTLADALHLDPAASFAYSTLEAFGSDPGLRSAQGWYVPWLCDANYIDAQAMIRRAVLQEFGGYRADDSIFGWEDWDLWLRLAEAGRHGVHVPRMLGRYRTQSGSMVSLTNLAAPDLRASLAARYATLPWPDSDRS